MILPWYSPWITPTINPNSGKRLRFPSIHGPIAPMRSAAVPAELLDHLVRTRGLPRSEARRIVEEVVSFYGETAEAFVTRRHRELQAEGLRNRAIYARVAVELEGRRFRAPRLSERQIRRIVYG